MTQKLLKQCIVIYKYNKSMPFTSGVQYQNNSNFVMIKCLVTYKLLKYQKFEANQGSLQIFWAKKQKK